MSVALPDTSIGLRSLPPLVAAIPNIGAGGNGGDQTNSMNGISLIGVSLTAIGNDLGVSSEEPPSPLSLGILVKHELLWLTGHIVPLPLRATPARAKDYIRFSWSRILLSGDGVVLDAI